MADIISLRDDPHQSTEMLLPWYATGQLDAVDAAAVDAHLGTCSQCRAALDREYRLKAAIAQLPLHADLGWEKLQRRLAPDPATEPRPWRAAQPRRWRVWPTAIAAFSGAQMLALAVAVLMFRPVPPPVAPQADYRTLGTPAVAGAGNLVVMFRPDTPEQELRFALDRAGARLVDGPTIAGAYVLHVDPDRRDAALADLRTRRSVTLAEPIDPGLSQ
ncbi:MAG TPA: zf-HC2 domain-containing protein [Sphingobium sp.]|nr:zf-HC2 domain-containing protein [Sphingobium sp.]